MRESNLYLAVDTGASQKTLAGIRARLLKKFPEIRADLIHGLLLRALNDGAVLTARATPGAGNDARP